MSSSKPPPSETEPSGREVKPHDALFRRAFSDVRHAAGELRHVLPSGLVEAVDWSTLRALETSVLDAELRELCSDLVFSVEVGGSEVLLYVLVEHQSRSDPMMGFRMLRYMVRLWDKWHAEHGGTRLPAIVPVVVHHGARAWSAPHDFAELVDLPEGAMAAVEELMPRFRYLVDDLATQAVEAIAARKVTDYAVLVLVCLARARRTSDLLGELRPLAPFVARVVEELGAAAYLALVRYILEVTEHDELEVLEFSRALGPVAEQVVMTGAEKLIEKGRAKGLEQGLEQGRATGQAEAVVTLLEKRFGGLSERQRVVIHGASLEQLGGWLERVLEVGSVEELIGG